MWAKSADALITSSLSSAAGAVAVACHVFIWLLFFTTHPGIEIICTYHRYICARAAFMLISLFTRPSELMRRITADGA